MCVPGPVNAGGLSFEELCAGEADLLLDPAIPDEDAAALEAQVRLDVVAVEEEFELPFEARPRIHDLATAPRYAAALRGLFGYSAATARWAADNSVAFFEPAARTIAVNWEAIAARRPIAAIRHELTHLLTLRACRPRCDLVPAWLNEGQAHLAEATIQPGGWRELRLRYEAASQAATGTLLPLAALETQESWNAVVGWAGYYKYQQAARVTELLRADVGGSAPIARLYERIRGGQSVAAAYAAMTGRSFAAFVDELPRRLGDAAAPGIATTRGTPQGPGLSYVLYGFEPASEITVAIEGPGASTREAVRVSPQGAAFAWLDDTWPSGRYALTAIAAGICRTVGVSKSGGRRSLTDREASPQLGRACAPPRVSARRL